MFSGVSNQETRDELPHEGGAGTGGTFGIDVHRSILPIGVMEWRSMPGANTLVQPMRKTWKRGTPLWLAELGCDVGPERL